jgi:hypothetical protein
VTPNASNNASALLGSDDFVVAKAGWENMFAMGEAVEGDYEE